MATLAKRLITVEEFLDIEWDDSDTKAELDNGVIRIMRMMAGGSGMHSRVQINIISTLRVKLKGSGCRPHGSDMAVLTGDYSVRYPDASVFCGRDGADSDKLKVFDDPRLLVEVLSPTTRTQDLEVKLPEYRALRTLKTILLIDPEEETIRLLKRDTAGEWTDEKLERGADVELSDLTITLTWDDIFARD